MKPTDPAVSAGPNAAAPAARSAMTATMPTNMATAGAPAFVSAIAENAIRANPAATRSTAAPTIRKAVPAAVICALVADACVISAIMPSESAAIPTTRPAMTAIAPPPAPASAIADCASSPKASAVRASPAPIIMMAFAAASIGPEVCNAADPVSDIPAAVEASLFPIPPAIAVARPPNALPIEVISPITNPAALRPMKAAATLGIIVIIFAIVSAWVSMNPASDIRAPETTLHTSAKLVKLPRDPKPLFSLPRDFPIAANAVPNDLPTCLAYRMNTPKYLLAFAKNVPSLPF